MRSSTGVALAAFSGVLLATSCGGGGGSTTQKGGVSGFTITIRGMTFSPAELDVPAGATISVVSVNETYHTVTSEAKEGDFLEGGVAGVHFDTGDFDTVATITIPADAPNGTVIPYFCKDHHAMMNPASIKIDNTVVPPP